MTFSQRMGLVKVRDAIQVGALDNETRIAIWNLISPYLRATQNAIGMTTIYEIWTEIFHQPSDSAPKSITNSETNLAKEERWYRFIRESVLNGQWNTCLDLVEYLANDDNRSRWDNQGIGVFDYGDVVAPKPDEYNAIFKKYIVGYRLVNGLLTSITSEDEISSIEGAIERASPSVKEQLNKALQDLSDREHPHYGKSVEAAISAVESQCCILLGKDNVTLGVALKQLETKGIIIHAALKEAFNKLYGYTSDADGIRHGSINPSEVDQELAKFMLVSCSAFVNYLIAKGAIHDR